jgi:hypothetical protein
LPETPKPETSANHKNYSEKKSAEKQRISKERFLNLDSNTVNISWMMPLEDSHYFKKIVIALTFF